MHASEKSLLGTYITNDTNVPDANSDSLETCIIYRITCSLGDPTALSKALQKATEVAIAVFYFSLMKH